MQDGREHALIVQHFQNGCTLSWACEGYKAIVGEKPFAHESGIHTRGVTEKPITFEPSSPISSTTRKLSRANLREQPVSSDWTRLGIQSDCANIEEIGAASQALGDKGKMVTDAASSR